MRIGIETLELAARGRAFVAETDAAAHAIDLPMHYIGRTVASQNFDGTARHDIAQLSPHMGYHASQAHLTRPLFVAPEISGGYADAPYLAGNPLVNARDCSPDTLLLVGENLIANRIFLPDEFKYAMIDRIGAIMLAGASPAHLMASLPEEPTFLCVDDERPNVYMMSGELFFPSLASKRIPALDVHDIAQHALQLSLYPREFTAVAGIAGRAFTNADNSSKDAILARSLSSFVWGVAFEEAVISDADQELSSYGCLNWLAPEDTPTDRIANLHDLSPTDQCLAYRWHCLDALKDLYRKQYAIDQQLCQTSDWMERLGYMGNGAFMDLCRSPEPYPFTPLDFGAADTLLVTAPSTPHELMNNAITLLKQEL